jgi:hypothetical protein
MKIRLSYISVEKAKDLEPNQLVLCKCPKWNDEGYQVAIWNGTEFEYSGQQNDGFNDLVTHFTKLDKNGQPMA